MVRRARARARAQAVWSVAFHDTGDFVVSASQDGTARLWDLASMRCRTTIRGHDKSVNSACFAPFSNTLATASSDKTVSLWDVRTGGSSGVCTSTLTGAASVCKVRYHPTGDVLAAADYDGVVTVRRGWRVC
jgi:WD40 repeat protein